MRTIQEVGMEILNKNPSKFYVFSGSEYGIKNKYLSILSEVYGGSREVSDVESVLSLMSIKHVVPLKPSLYVVRYDNAFISSLSSETAKRIDKLNIKGTLVCIYDYSTKGVNKLEKYLPDYTVNVDKIDKQFIVKYLHSDFPGVPDRLISLAAEMCDNYGDAQNLCRSMSLAPVDDLFAMSDEAIASLLGKSKSSTDAQIRSGIASRNFKYLIDTLESYSGDSDSVFYSILSTMLDLEKLFSNSRSQSDLRDYLGRWTLKDVYNMFMNTYFELKKLRTYATDSKSSLIYLFGLLKFSEIPSVEDML